MKRRLSLLALALALGLGLGCATEPRGGAPADDVTMAVLGTVRALHHEADVFEHAGDYARASQAVRRVLAIEYPRGMLEAPDLRADAWGRLAELALRAGNADDALSQANAGLEEARAETVFRARLLMVKGQSLGALADRARDVGDAAAERRHRDEALEALEASIAMNQRVLARVADGGAP